VITLVAKEAAEEITGAGPYTITLAEVKAIGGEAWRTVLTLTADAEIVTSVLKQRLTAERKSGAERPELEPTSGEEHGVLINDSANNTHVI
jgi:hypothetical protein